MKGDSANEEANINYDMYSNDIYFSNLWGYL